MEINSVLTDMIQILDAGIEVGIYPAHEINLMFFGFSFMGIGIGLGIGFYFWFVWKLVSKLIDLLMTFLKSQ